MSFYDCDKDWSKDATETNAQYMWDESVYLVVVGLRIERKHTMQFFETVCGR